MSKKTKLTPVEESDHFQVEVRPDHHDKGMVLVRTTSNGFQWSSLSVHPEQLAKVRDAINQYLAKKGTP